MRRIGWMPRTCRRHRFHRRFCWVDWTCCVWRINDWRKRRQPNLSLAGLISFQLQTNGDCQLGNINFYVQLTQVRLATLPCWCPVMIRKVLDVHKYQGSQSLTINTFDVELLYGESLSELLYWAWWENEKDSKRYTLQDTRGSFYRSWS